MTWCQPFGHTLTFFYLSESTPQELKTQSPDKPTEDQSSQLRPELPIREPEKHTNATSSLATELDLFVQTQILTNTSSPAEERLAEASTASVAGDRKPSQAPRDPTFASQADPVRNETAVNSDSRSSTPDGDRDRLCTFWVCHRCREPYLLETTPQCLNFDCQHVYCERKCTVERHWTRSRVIDHADTEVGAKSHYTFSLSEAQTTDLLGIVSTDPNPNP